MNTTTCITASVALTAAAISILPAATAAASAALGATTPAMANACFTENGRAYPGSVAVEAHQNGQWSRVGGGSVPADGCGTWKMVAGYYYRFTADPAGVMAMPSSETCMGASPELFAAPGAHLDFGVTDFTCR